MTALIFIDTNIFLDFYRFPSGAAGLSMLKHIDSNHQRIITTTQVEMEYKKNRQRVILESLRSIKTPEWANLKAPEFLSDSAAVKSIEKFKKEIDNRTKKVKARVERVLARPVANDLVYRTIQRL